MATSEQARRSTPPFPAILSIKLSNNDSSKLLGLNVSVSRVQQQAPLALSTEMQGGWVVLKTIITYFRNRQWVSEAIWNKVLLEVRCVCCFTWWWNKSYVHKFARYSPASHLQSVKIFAVVTASNLFFTVCVIACCSQSNSCAIALQLLFVRK